MNEYVIFLLTILLFSCVEEDKIIDRDTLKYNGYTAAKCKSIESYTIEDYTYIDIFSKMSEDKKIIARCYDNGCSLKVSKEKKVICQRYSFIVEDKREYLDNSYKEFVDHLLLYKEIKDKN
jgi:hypothetical protein